MAVKKFALNQTHGFIGDKPKSKAPTKPFVESAALEEYRTHRNICYYIQHGGECEWSEGEVERVRGIYFKTLF